MGNPWLLFLWLILLDIYITNIIPWGWWKKKKGPTRIVMAWVDAIVYALVLMLFAVVSVYGQDNVIDEVVWVVGDEAILKSDVENERLNAQYEGRKFDGDPYCIIPEQLAIQKLFLHQAAIDSIEVSEQEIISDVERRTSWLIDQIGSKEKVEEYYNGAEDAAADCGGYQDHSGRGSSLFQGSSSRQYSFHPDPGGSADHYHGA